MDWQATVQIKDCATALVQTILYIYRYCFYTNATSWVMAHAMVRETTFSLTAGRTIALESNIIEEKHESCVFN